MRADLEKLELFIAQLLRKGVLLAGLFILIGWIFQINFKYNTFADFKTYQTLNMLETLIDLWNSHSWAKLIAYAGLFVLISLPVLRVLATGVIFIKQKNLKFVLLVGLVLFGLTLSLVLGFEV